jgi:hypothetical protein
MRGSFLALICLALSLAGCGKSTEPEQNFDSNFTTSCIASAANHQVPVELADAACKCALQAINKKYPADQRAKLTLDQLKPIMAPCLNESMKQ